MDQKKYLQTLHFNKQTKEGLTMNKLLNNLENKLKDVEQDITSLNSIKVRNGIEIDILIDAKEEQKEDLENDIFQVKQLKRDLENDKTIQDVLKSFESFKSNIGKELI